MTHLPSLIADLGLILSVAAVTTLVFRRIKQPLVLGYILAGLLVGPHIGYFPTVVDEKSITTWSEIGVIFLLFSLGLEFSFKKLVAVGGTAGVTAIVEVIGMLAVGFFVGQAMGWSSMDSIFLGGVLSISSTTIIIRAFEELGVKTQGFASLVFGVLVVEDLVAILLLVLLSTLAISQQFSGGELLFEMGKLGFFLVLWFLGGILLIPSFLNRAKKLMTDETLLIVSVALCLSMVYLAVQAGFSAALGAFIMGSILAETVMAERIEHTVKPVKDLFAAIFFVSVGMLIDPRMLLTHWWPVLVITVATIVGKFLSSAGGALLAGQSLKRSVQAGLSLAQIGEFSFIIATLGLTLKVTSSFLYPIAVAVSAITTFTTPYLIKASPDVATWLSRVLPKSWVDGLERYSAQTGQVKVTSDWKVLMRAYALNIVVFAVLSLAVIILGYRFLPRVFGEGIGWFDGELIAGFVTMILVVPFIWAMSFRRIKREAYQHLWLNRKQLRGPLVIVELARVLIAVLMLSILVNQFFSTGWALILAITIFSIAIVVFRRKLQHFYGRVEQRFFTNLNQREARKRRPELAPWDMHLAEIPLREDSIAIGRSLLELQLREKFGVNVALIERGERSIPVPSREERLLPGDNLLLIGTDEQLAAVNKALDTPLAENGAPGLEKEEIRLGHYRVLPQSPLVGRTIRESGIREKAFALVTGIERNDQRIPNPESTVRFESNDLLWLVGNGERINTFMSGVACTRE